MDPDSPLVDPAGSPTVPLSSNPTVPAYADDQKWIASYMYVHAMSSPSKRYIYFLWFAVFLFSLIYALLHCTGSKHTLIGAYCSKFMLRRRTWRRSLCRTGGGYPVVLPSNAQLLSLSLLTLATLALTFLGPDYIAPSASFWQFYQHHDQQQPPSTSASSRALKLDESLIYPYVLQYTVPKAWWTSGGRTGLIAFALFPLCILFALKAPPFALFALPFTIQFHFDKLAWLHRWSARLIWLITACHVALWSVQLVIDQHPDSGKNALHYAWKHSNFIFGWIAFTLLTLIIVLSLQPIRKKYYESFYILHVLMVPLMLITAALHHPPVSLFCWAALGLWVAERSWRAIRWLTNNGFFSTRAPAAMTSEETSDLPRKLPSPPSNVRGLPKASDPYGRESMDKPGYLNDTLLSPESPPACLSPNGRTYIPPPGYCHAELLSGSTVRLHFITPTNVSWAPGQYFLINIPSISKFTSHPFTVASICDAQAPTDAGRALVFLIRTKTGWTKQLWDRVAQLATLGMSHPKGEKPPSGTETPARGALFRMRVDGPFGSVVRARWGSHSTVVIVAGGSGVSFGLSVLQYLCLCMAGREGRHLGGKSSGCKGFSTTRIRFIWLVREYAHIQWCASAILRCLSTIPPPGLEVDIFVTHHKSLFDSYIAPPPRTIYPPLPNTEESVRLVRPPSPTFTRPHSPSGSLDGLATPDGGDSYVDLSYFTSEYGDEERDVADPTLFHQNYILDLTNFDGDNDATLPGEEALNRRVMRTSSIRRQNSRRAAKAAEDSAKQQQQQAEHEGGQGRSVDQVLQQIPEHPTFKVDNRHSMEESPVGRPTSNVRFDGRPPSPARAPPPWMTPSATLPDPFEDNATLASQAPSSLLTNNEWDVETSDSTSYRGLLGRGAGDDIRLQVDELEMHDVNMISEHARPGKPRIDRILADEIEKSQGSVVVACCGPSSLNAIVRKSVASRIDPGRIRRGDMRGLVVLFSEEFSF